MKEMNDLIRRKDAIEAMHKKCVTEGLLDEFDTEDTLRKLPSAVPERKWIPFKFRELTEEEKEWHPDWDYMMDCQLPENEQEILVSDGKYVWFDTFYNDNDGCCLDGDMDLDGIAWMPLPEPWRGE